MVLIVAYIHPATAKSVAQVPHPLPIPSGKAVKHLKYSFELFDIENPHLRNFVRVHIASCHPPSPHSFIHY